MLPTAHASFVEMFETALSEATVPGGCGTGTILHLAPSQCSASGFANRVPRDDPPTAQMSFAVITLTPLRKLLGEGVFGLVTMSHAQVWA